MALKRTSQIMTIGAGVTESAPNTFTQQTIDLQLNPLDNEVLLVYSVDLQPQVPDAQAATNTRIQLSLARTTQTGLVNINSDDCIASTRMDISAAGFVDGGVGFESRSLSDTPQADIPYIGIVATSNLFLGIEGGNNIIPKSGVCRIWCARAKADASTYAALVQSELLSD